VIEQRVVQIEEHRLEPPRSVRVVN
jgi:hypothetical protein